MAASTISPGKDITFAAKSAIEDAKRVISPQDHAILKHHAILKVKLPYPIDSWKLVKTIALDNKKAQRQVKYSI
jgi:hypothetical protein